MSKEDFWDTKEFVVSLDPCIILQEMWTSHRCFVNMLPGLWKTYLLGGDSISGLISCLHICLCLTAAHKRGRPGVKSWRIELPRTRGVWSDMFQTHIHHSLSVTHFVVPCSLSLFLLLSLSQCYCLPAPFLNSQAGISIITWLYAVEMVTCFQQKSSQFCFISFSWLEN